MEQRNKYTILLCRYTGKVGIVRRSDMVKKKVLVCTNRQPITYTPMTVKDTIILGWVMAPNINIAYLRVPSTLRKLNEHTPELSIRQNSSGTTGQNSLKD